MRQEGSANGGLAAQQLRDSEEHFKLLVESVRDYAIFTIDQEGFVASWNAGAERIKGYDASEIIGKHFSAFYPPDEIAAGRPERQLARARELGRVEDEGWRLRKDGSLFWANVIITALYDDGGVLRGYAKVTRDLTERRVREAAERRALLHQEASRQKDEFLAIVSHELRTPLNVATGQAAMLRRGTLSAEQAERAWESLQRNLALQAQIVEDILDVSRVVTGKLVLDERSVDVRGLLNEALEEAGSSARPKGLQLDVSLPDREVAIVGDRARLLQVFSNILNNAVKFTSHGGRVTVTCVATEGLVEVRVADTGIGIDPEFLPRIFERFTQEDTTARREFAGLGLGLAIARELVARHGGTIGAESPGRGLGASFSVRLPLAPAHPS
jgi:PAS domain S-box-containing protein